MNGLRRTLSAIDGAVFQIERLLLFVSLLMMTLLVSVDVVQRTFSRPEGRVATFLIWLTGAESEEKRQAILSLWSPLLFGLVAAAFFVFAAHSARLNVAERSGGAKPKLLASAAIGLGVLAGCAILVQLILWAFPSSLPGAQKFALGFMLWAGMLGASLATRARRHIVLDAVKKKLDPQIAPLFGLLGAIATVAFTGYVGFLGALQVKEQVVDWMSGPGIGVYESVPVPYWAVTLAIPVTFFTISARFLAQGIGDFVFGPPAQTGPDSHGIDLDALAQQSGEGKGA